MKEIMSRALEGQGDLGEGQSGEEGRTVKRRTG